MLTKYNMHNDFTNYGDKQKDLPAERKIKYTDESYIVAYQEPIRGHWVLKTETGSLPVELNGATFTTFKHAEEAVRDYTLRRDRLANQRESKAEQQRLEHTEFLKRRRRAKTNGS